MNCKTRGRRPSERDAMIGQCPDPIHDVADAGPELLALLTEAERMYSARALVSAPVPGFEQGHWINRTRNPIDRIEKARPR